MRVRRMSSSRRAARKASTACSRQSMLRTDRYSSQLSRYLGAYSYASGLDQGRSLIALRSIYQKWREAMQGFNFNHSASILAFRHSQLPEIGPPYIHRAYKSI